MESARKSIIVTGGASGIGLAITRHFLSQGHRIAIVDINADVGPKVANELAREFPTATVAFKKCDVASWDEQSAIFKEVFVEHGNRLDIVVANAGVAEGKVVTVVDLEEDEPTPPRLTTLEINLIGVIYSVKLAAHYMNKKSMDGAVESRGSIICTASNVGLYPLPTSPLYSTTKFGVVGLVRSLAYMLSKAKIQINALAPSLIETNIIGPDHSLFSRMTLTPMETLIRGVSQLLADAGTTGQVAEIHGESVTIRPHHEYVDETVKATITQLGELSEEYRALWRAQGIS
ncbi:hypothetical protein QBC34DRAFT_416312 [Podospora aff. communis PSN243]|uniref:Uncharacterized protein n=1 Tax=Podospora aff. communis PSN243 TaxID=3040156 RepID=A0AAV9G5Q4_9PEZI|nr:hypothetical protein QBC34DRAFT_416312 [Podospora aff. communis PSN243]